MYASKYNFFKKIKVEKFDQKGKATIIKTQLI